MSDETMRDDDGQEQEQTRAPEAPHATELKALHQTQRSLEKLRVGLTNRVKAVDRNVDELTPEIKDLYDRLQVAAEGWEDEIETLMARQVTKFPVWDYWLKHVKGIAPQLASHLLSQLLPPLPERGPSTWFKSAGLNPELRDGQYRLPRARKGEGAITYHAWLRRCLFLVSTSFVRTGGYYREVYEQQYIRLFRLHCWEAARLYDEWMSTSEGARVAFMENRYPIATMTKAMTRWLTPSATERKHDYPELTAGMWAAFSRDLADARVAGVNRDAIFPDQGGMHGANWLMLDRYELTLMEPKGAKAYALVGGSDEMWPLARIDDVARWATIKLFLSHLYEMWLESEGQTGRKAYVVEQLGHHYIEPPRPNGKKDKL